MLTLHSLALTFLCSLSFLSAVLSIQCSKSQYAWPRNKDELCCQRCPPGERMLQRSETICEIQCVSCVTGQYKDTHNVDLTCEFCRSCKASNMEYESHCNSTHDAVCRCKVGYRCKDQPCTKCVEIPTTVTNTLPPSSPTTTTSDKLPPPSTATKLQPPLGDTVWLLVIVILLCAVVGVVVLAKTYSFQRWVRCKLGYLAEKLAPVSTSSEEGEVSKPIQEVCGKCDP